MVSIETLLGTIMADKDTGRGTAGEFAVLATETATTTYSVRRYLALASQNFCHFAATANPHDDGPDALRLYREYHARAMREAARAASNAGFRRALVTDAFGCHFLTDLFASGHMRVPRRRTMAPSAVRRYSG